MSELFTFEAELRDRSGKGAARALRRAGRVPAVIYGDKKDPIAISLDPGQLISELYKPGFFIHQFTVKAKGEEHRVMAREVQFHPITDKPIHVDFLRVTEKTQVTVNVPMEFVNEEESPGIDRGGVLNIVRYDVEVRCAVGNIPEILTADLSGLDIGDSVKISDVTLPQGVEPTITDRDFTIATIAAPTLVAEEAAEEQEEEAEEELLEGEEVEGAEEEGAEEEGAEEEGGEEEE